MKFIEQIFPIVGWVRNYRKEFLRDDLFAGITVGIMLIPQGMAYALIAGMPPVYGLYASIVPSLVYAVMGTSRQLSVAPVAMDSLLVAAGVSVLATEGTDAYIGFAILLAFFMGIFQMLLGVFRLGFITNLLSRPVISGFTAAAALIIGLNQLKYFLGINLEKSNKVYEIIWDAIQRAPETHLVTLIIGVAGILIIKGSKKINKNIPGSLVAVVLGILLVYFMSLDQEGVSIVGLIPKGLPDFIFPDLSLGQFGALLPTAMTISVVAFMEAFSVAKAIEGKRKNYKVRPNQELLALGAANLFGSFFQAFPVTGGFSRSAVNDQAGAHTPLSSMVSALLIALTLIFLTPLFYYLPKAILASVIMVAVAGLIDWRYALRLFRDSKIEFVLFMITFIVTLNFGMVNGIVSGIVFSILILLYRAAYPHIAELGRLDGNKEYRNVQRFQDLTRWDDILILRVDAPLTFINIQYVKDYIERTLSRQEKVRYLILDASPVSHLDATANQGLEDIIASLKTRNIQFLMSDVIGPVRDVLFRTGTIDVIGKDHLFLCIDDAVKYAETQKPTEYRTYTLQSNP